MHSLNFRLSSDIVATNITESDILPELCSLEELTLINNINKGFDTIDQLCTGLTSLENIKNVITRDGITPAFYDMMNDTLVDNFMLDLTPYVKKETNECTMALESLGSIITTVCRSIVDFFKRIGKWFSDLFSMWVNKHERYRHRINKINRELTRRFSKVDANKFRETTISGYPYAIYQKMFNAIVNMLRTLKNVNYNSLETLNIKNSFGNDLISCGYIFDESGTMIAPTTTAFITLPASRMGWTSSKVWDFSQAIPNKLLVDAMYIRGRETQMENTITLIVREIERGLAGGTAIDVAVLRKRKAAASCLKHITHYMLAASAGMARQYINMCDQFKYL